jgi:hypothetical protein
LSRSGGSFDRGDSRGQGHGGIGGGGVGSGDAGEPGGGKLVRLGSPTDTTGAAFTAEAGAMSKVAFAAMKVLATANKADPRATATIQARWTPETSTCVDMVGAGSPVSFRFGEERKKASLSFFDGQRFRSSHGHAETSTALPARCVLPLFFGLVETLAMISRSFEPLALLSRSFG